MDSILFSRPCAGCNKDGRGLHFPQALVFCEGFGTQTQIIIKIVGYVHGHSKREVDYSNVVLLRILYQRGKWTWPKLDASMEVRRYKFI